MRKRLLRALTVPVLLLGFCAAAHAESVCTPTDQLGRPCISDPKTHQFEGGKYVALHVTNSCDITLHVYAYPKSGKRFGKGIVPGRHSVGYCETKECQGFSRFEVVCPSKKPKSAAGGSATSTKQEPNETANTSRSPAQPLDEYAKRLTAKEQPAYQKCIAGTLKSTPASRRAEYERLKSLSSQDYRGSDRERLLAAYDKNWPLYEKFLGASNNYSLCFYMAKFPNGNRAWELYSKTADAKRAAPFYDQWSQAVSPTTIGIQSESSKREAAAWKKRKAEIDAYYDARDRQRGSSSNEPCVLGHKPGDPDPCAR